MEKYFSNFEQIIEDEFTLIEKQYKLAVDARDKLNDNYYKWMSYYYLANAGVVVAITSLYSKSSKNGCVDNGGVLCLSLIGVFVCILWNLSCKGYYYWSKSWIDLIIRFEKGMSNKNKNFGVYSIFSQEVAEKEDSWVINKPANISTPKLTLLFSFFCIICWMIYSTYQFFQFSTLNSCFNTLIAILFIIILSVLYFGIFKIKFLKSRGESHRLVNCQTDLYI